MKIPAIKKLVETYTIAQLQAAEEAILEEQTPAIEIDGEDEGEQLTHVTAAIAVLQDMEQNGVDARTGIRNYTVRVRNSIG